MSGRDSVESRDQRKAHYNHYHTSGQNIFIKYFLEIKKKLLSNGRNTNEGQMLRLLPGREKSTRSCLY